jgi:hypothetical protein
MQKTTVYIPEELRTALRRAAAGRGCSEAALIREALRAVARSAPGPRPRLPLFKSGRRGLAERVERALAGFGQR